MSPADDQPDFAFTALGAPEIAPPTDRDAYLAAVSAGLAELDGGQEIPADAVWRWVASWGTDAEPPPPEPGCG